MKNLRTICLAGLIVASASPAHAALHLFDIQEAYSNSDGSVQFIELFTSSNSQNQLSGHTLVFLVGATATNTFTFPTNLGSTATANKSVLIGTANLFALYGVAPDYVISANFFTAGANNTLNFAENTDIINIANLPTDGVMSLNGLVANDGQTAGDTAINAMATPTNFAGATATIPEPGAASLSLLALGTMLLRRKRG